VQSALEWEVVVAEPRALASTDRLLAPAVAASLAALDLSPEDEAAARLAEVYARSLDGAAGMEAAARKVLRGVDGDDPDLLAQVQALVQAVSARKALVDLGPKLTALLVELGATPKVRAWMATSKPAAPGGEGVGAGLARLRSVVPPGA
jgi:hypothetical protein